MHKVVQKSDFSVAIEGTEKEAKKVSEHGKAAIYTVLGDVYETSDAKEKDAKSGLLGSNNSDDQGANGASDSSQDSGIQLFGGKNFYMSNGNPFQMYMDLLLSRGKLMEINSDLKSYTELAQSGLTLNDDGTVSGDGSKGFASMIYSQTIDAANQQAQQTNLQGSQELSSGVSDILAVGFTNALAGNVDKEQNDVDKLENALSKLDTIDTGAAHVGEIQNKITEENKLAAISKLKNNEYDVTKEGQHFGSVEEVKGNKTSYKKDTRENTEGNEFKIPGTDVSVEDAYACAGVPGQEQIKKNFTSKLDEAKKTLEKALKGLDNKRDRIKTVIGALNKATASGLLFGKQTFILNQAKAEAEKQVDQMLQQSLQSVEGSAGTAYKNSQDTLSNTLSELQGIMRNIRTGG